jgi:hypothetical protein
MREADIRPAAAEVCARPYANPRPVTEADVCRILAAAWAGE